MSKIIINRLDYARIKKYISDAKQFKSITSIEADRTREFKIWHEKNKRGRK